MYSISYTCIHISVLFHHYEIIVFALYKSKDQTREKFFRIQVPQLSDTSKYSRFLKSEFWMRDFFID